MESLCLFCQKGYVYIKIRKSGKCNHNAITKKLNLKLSKHIQISMSQKLFQLILLPDSATNIVAYSLQISKSNMKEIMSQSTLLPPFSPSGSSVKGSVMQLPIDSGDAARVRTNK